MTKFINKTFSVPSSGICFENCRCLFCTREKQEKETEKELNAQDKQNND